MRGAPRGSGSQHGTASLVMGEKQDVLIDAHECQEVPVHGPRRTQPQMSIILPTHRVLRGLPGFDAGALRQAAARYFDVTAAVVRGGPVSFLLRHAAACAICVRDPCPTSTLLVRTVTVPSPPM